MRQGDRGKASQADILAPSINHNSLDSGFRASGDYVQIETETVSLPTAFGNGPGL